MADPWVRCLGRRPCTSRGLASRSALYSGTPCWVVPAPGPGHPNPGGGRLLPNGSIVDSHQITGLGPIPNVVVLMVSGSGSGLRKADGLFPLPTPPAATSSIQGPRLCRHAPTKSWQADVCWGEKWGGMSGSPLTLISWLYQSVQNQLGPDARSLAGTGRIQL